MRPDRGPVAAVAAMVVAGLVLRLLSYHSSLYGDEFYTHMEIADATGPLNVVYRIQGSLEVSPPLWFLFAWLTHAIDGAPESLRIPSVVAGSLTIPAIWLLGRRVAGERVGLVAAGLVTLSPFAIFYAGEARPYALAMLLPVLMMLALLRALEQPDRLRWGLLAMVSAACFYTHYTTIFPVAAAFAWALLAYPQLRRRIALTAVATAILYLPWLGFVSGKRSLSMYGHVHGRVLEWLMSSIGHASIASPYVPIRTIPGPVLLAIALACVAIGAVAQRRRRPKPDSPGVLTAAVAIALPTGLSTYSALTNVNLLGARNMSAAFGAFAVLIAVAVAGPRQRRLAVALSGITLCIWAAGAWMSLQPVHERPDLKAAARILNRIAPANTVIATSGLNRATIYLDRRHPTFHIASRDRAWQLAVRERRPIAFLVTDYIPANTPLIPALAGRHGYRQVCLRSFGGFLPARMALYVPPGTRSPATGDCPPQGTVETTALKDIPDTIILACGNGSWLLPQHEPLSAPDLLGPAIGLLALAGGGVWIVRRRRPAGH